LFILQWHVLELKSYIIIAGKTAPLFFNHSLPERILPHCYPAFTSLDFATIFLQSKTNFLASDAAAWTTSSLYLCPPVIPPGTGSLPLRLTGFAVSLQPASGLSSLPQVMSSGL
jgi:hypothetical protein